ncbi:hypothetical protein GCM10009799_32950 [Nocardiopsis rhodophaea]|uniref:Uncharacterized protein n=1 Tax=Nocardiopsis rhodophaea TaxID=280238 RepID=A0ABN2TAB1_9ACTN
MIVECVGTRGTDLPHEQVELYGAPQTVFDLQLGKFYTVYGITLAGGTLDVLLNDETGKPGWYPMALFKVTDPHLPSHWEFASFVSPLQEGSEERQTTDTARWGYPEIVHSEKHNIGLIEREYEDLRIFYLEQQRYQEGTDSATQRT